MEGQHECKLKVMNSKVRWTDGWVRNMFVNEVDRDGGQMLD